MSKLKLQVPLGTGDYLPQECAEKRRLEQNIREVFSLNGYDEIETPSFEYYDVFTHDAVPYVQENMIKFFDLKGRILALRPDMTGPIARLAATKCPPDESALRFCYIGNVYGFKGASNRAEATQAGVELIGKRGAEADAEVISVAIRGLLACGLEQFKIDIGQVSFFKGMMQEISLTEEQQERVRTLVDSKNSVELEYELGRMNIGKEQVKSLLQLTDLFGGEEVFDMAEGLAKNDMCRGALANIREVYAILCDYGYCEYISIDFGLLNDFNYYTGILFRGIADGIGVPLMSGGRYDKLLREFGADVPATGFALGIKEVLRVLEQQQKLNPSTGKIIVIKCMPAQRKHAYEFAQRLRDGGKRVIIETNGTVYDAEKYETVTFE